ncbi:LCP family protein [Salinicoccus hispanicus]|uniref:LytR family transcriptional regulator n=1 Tax=Salinicoccus hispanicus TaxID=157225 RepID=A0A6N8U5P3_9STAP|nr:LCP family protein [Salinicoccus hispanicus]MXQ50929.1 LytR family transcriptional regulator [Salinicoccus hispanicus]
MKRKIFYGVLIFLVIALVVIGAYIYNLFNSFEQGVSDSFEATDRDRSELRLDDIDPSLDSFTVLILGIDESESRKEKDGLSSEDFRTDTMILATFDKTQDEVKLVSIPRDTLAYFPENNYYDKITHAHRENGPEGSMRAVESLLNVPVDFYVRVNMTAVVDMVDALGGVEFDVPFDMNEPNQLDKGRIELEAGVQELNGEEALAVVRSRRVDTDLGRGQRQLEMVQKILGKAKTTGALTKLDDLIEVVADNTKHDMSSKEIRSLAAYYSFNDIEFDTTQLRGDDFWFQGNGAYFYWANEEHLYLVSKKLREILELEEPEPYDLMNIRLSDYIVPYQYVDDYYLDEFVPETEPYFMREGFESTLGDGFDIPENNPEDSIEGEENIESSEEPDGEGVPQQEDTTKEPAGQGIPQEGATTEEDNYWDPEDGNGSEGIQEESTEQYNYEDSTEQYNNEQAPGEYYEESTEEFGGTGNNDIYDRAQNEV